MKNIFSRTALVFGNDVIEKFQKTRVAIIGLGGVGSFASEILVRSGIENIVLVDFDTISESNINRQLPALHSTIGKYKTDTMKARLLDINPDASIIAYTEFMDETNREKILEDVDYVIDAIDSLNPKANLLEYLYKNKIEVISVLGAGGKTDPSYIKEGDLFQTTYCPLAKRVRKYLRRRGITSGIPAIYSDEQHIPQSSEINNEDVMSRGRQRGTLGSVVYLPAMMGMWAASYVLRKIAKKNEK